MNEGGMGRREWKENVRCYRKKKRRKKRNRKRKGYDTKVDIKKRKEEGNGE